jgi:hypothetical protein
MKKTTIMVLFLLLCPLWAVLGQQSQGEWEPFKDVKDQKRQESAGQQAGQPLTNDSIMKLVKAGLGEGTIISIVDTQPGKYSVGADDIAALKKAGVSEKVITAMLDRSASGQVRRPTRQPQVRKPPGVSGPPKPPPTPNMPGLYAPGPDDTGVAVPPSPPRPPIPAHPVAQTLVFDDIAYHRCSARDELMRVMTPEQKAAFKDEEPCPFSAENDRAYHACLEEHNRDHVYAEDHGDIPQEDVDDYIRRQKYLESLCAKNVSDPHYVRSHPATIAIQKVRKVYVDKFFGAGGIKKMIRNGTCLEVVDSPDEADALLRVDHERQEYDGTESGDIYCSRHQCTDGVTIADEYGIRHIIRDKFILVDPRTAKTVEGWYEYKDSISSKNFARFLGEAAGCGRGN